MVILDGMKKMALLMGLAACTVASASSPDVYTEFDTVLSLEGESQDQFVLRIAPLLRERTMETGWELCGALAYGEDRHGVILTSSQSSVACVVHKGLVPGGMVATGLSIHSHPGPNSKQNVFNAMDKALAGYTGHTLNTTKTGNKRYLDGFSEQDMRLGPGYLVLEQQVLFQQGPGTVRRVGKIPK